MKISVPPCDLCHKRYGTGELTQNGKTYRICLHCSKRILESMYKRNHPKSK